MDGKGDWQVVGRGLRIVGDLESSGPLRVEGFLQGRLFTPDRLEIAAGAKVEGIVQARAIDVRGGLSGIVRAAEEVRVFPGGELGGDVEAPRVRFVRVEEESGEGSPVAARDAEASRRHEHRTAPVVRETPPPPAEGRPAAPAPKPPASAPAPGPLPDWSFPRRAPSWVPRSQASGSAGEEDRPAAAVAAEEPRLPSITGESRQIVVRRR
jgi:hypothetical protein